MGYSGTQNLKYYLSGIAQDLFITIGVILLFVLIGNGSLEDDITGDPGDGGVVQFDGVVLLILIVSLAIGSVLFYLIFTRLGSRGIRVLYGIVLAMPFLLLLFEIFELLFTQSPGLVRTVSLFGLSIIIPIFGVVFTYVYISGKFLLSIRNTGIVAASVIIGRIMALYFDLAGIVVFAILLSVFDIYSVFRGPLAKIMGKPQVVDNRTMAIPDKSVMDQLFSKICEEGTPVLLSYQNTILGIGDVLFFSILLYNGLLVWGWIGLLVTFVMIIIGSSLTLYFLQKISPLPGLPLPVLFSLIGYGLLFIGFNLL